jgi:hypothetical protein
MKGNTAAPDEVFRGMGRDKAEPYPVIRGPARVAVFAGAAKEQQRKTRQAEIKQPVRHAVAQPEAQTIAYNTSARPLIQA